jgi:hypothetical protein
MQNLLPSYMDDITCHSVEDKLVFTCYYNEKTYRSDAIDNL